MKYIFSRNRIQTILWRMTVVFTLLMIALRPLSLQTYANTVIGKPVNFVMVLDCSESMWTNDKDGLTKKSALMFIDELPHENVNLSIIVFGCDYGEEAFDIGIDDPDCRNRVKVAFPLQDISTMEAREKAQKAIETETSRQEDGTLTPIGYALQAAVSVLEDAGTEEDHAAIILLSDGRLKGQIDGDGVDELGIAHNYYSVNDATQRAADKKWRIYAMELNYHGKTKEGNGLDGVAYSLMREKIPRTTGTDPLELTSSDQALDLFQSIMKKYYGTVPVSTTSIQMNDPYSFFIDEWTAESTISIFGDVDKIEKLNLRYPVNGQVIPGELSIDISEGSRRIGDYIISVNEGYIALTLLVPEPGSWVLTVEGNGKYRYRISRIALQECNLQIESDRESGEVDRGTTVNFSASFVYNDILFESEDLYSNKKAELKIKKGNNGTETAEMTPSKSNYSASYSFDKAGSYTVYVHVNGNMFRNGYKESGEFTYTVKNAPPVVIENGKIDDQKTYVGKNLPAINVAELFSDPDGDPLSFRLEVPEESEIDFRVTNDGRMTIMPGNRSGVFTVKAVASDEASTEDISFTISVENHPVELLTEEKIDVSLVTKKSEKDVTNDSYTIKWDETFKDPDGNIPEINVQGASNEIIKNDIDGGITFTALKPGKAEYQIIATDANDPAEKKTVTVSITAKSEFGDLIKSILPFVLVFVVAIMGICFTLILLLHDRHLNYGKWLINGKSYYVSNEDVAKGASFFLDDLLKAIGQPSGFGNVKVCAGTTFKKKVYIENLNQIDSATLDGIEIKNENGKKMELSIGKVFCLQNGDEMVTLKREKA